MDIILKIIFDWCLVYLQPSSWVVKLMFYNNALFTPIKVIFQMLCFGDFCMRLYTLGLLLLLLLLLQR